MSKAWSAPALVLRRWPAGESALLVRFLTPHIGLVTAKVGGAQKPTGSLHFLGSPFTLAEIQVVPTRGMPIVTQATPLGTFPSLQESLSRLQAASVVLEGAEAASVEGLANPSLFLLTCDTLRALELSSAPTPLLLAWCWQMLDGLGSAPVLNRCIRTGTQEAGEFVVPLTAEGGFASAAAAQGMPLHERLPVDLLHLLHAVSEAAGAESLEPDLSPWLEELQLAALRVLLRFLEAAVHTPLKTIAPLLDHHAPVQSQHED